MSERHSGEFHDSAAEVGRHGQTPDDTGETAGELSDTDSPPSFLSGQPAGQQQAEYGLPEPAAPGGPQPPPPAWPGTPREGMDPRGDETSVLDLSSLDPAAREAIEAARAQRDSAAGARPRQDPTQGLPPGQPLWGGPPHTGWQGGPPQAQPRWQVRDFRDNGARQPANAQQQSDWGDPEGAWQGSGARWSYVDNIRSAELVPQRKIPPGRGWRRVLYKSTLGLINLGRSPDERRQAELEAKVRSLLRGRYKIGVLGKGGVGKTTISASVGSMFAELRQDDRVVAVDADTAFGKLGLRVDPNASGSYWELAADRNLHTFADIRTRVGNNPSGLFVLAGESATARRRVLNAAIYHEATSRLDAHFTLSIIDCGSTLDSEVTQAVMSDLDALIVVSSPWVDGASAAGQTLEYLANNGFTGLLQRTVVVLNDSDGHADKRTRKVLVERFGGRGQKVIEMPFDEHLRPGGVIDISSGVNRVTRRRILELAAALAEHFAATTDAPRERR